MKYFMFVFSVIALFFAYGISEAGYIDEAGLAACRAGTPYSIYRNSGPGRHALPRGFNCEFYDFVDQQVPSGEYSAPAAAPEDCADNVACSALISTGTYCDAYGAEYVALWGDLDDDGDLEAWCTAPLTMTIRALRENSVEKASYDSAQAAKAAADSSRATARAQRMAQCETALADWANASPADVKRCVRFLLYKVHRK